MARTHKSIKLKTVKSLALSTDVPFSETIPVLDSEASMNAAFENLGEGSLFKRVTEAEKIALKCGAYHSVL